MIYSAAVDVSVPGPTCRKKRTSVGSGNLKPSTIQDILIKLCTNRYVRTAAIILYFGLCVLYYQKVESWSVTNSILFVIVTASTVGYGNIHPTTEKSQVFTIFLMMFGVFVIFSSMSGILNAGIVKLNKFLAHRVTSQLKRTELLFQRRLIFSIIWIVLCVFIGACIFQALEGWSYITALYFVMQTIMTIGYGDLVIQNQATKIFLIFYILLSTTLLGLAINNVYTLLQNRKFLSQRKQLLKLQRKLHFLADMNDGRGVNKFEFVLTILEHIGTLDHDKDIAPWLKKFKDLDTYETGILDQQQLAQFSQQHASECEQEIQELEQVALSVSNVQALPSAAKTVLEDLRVRSMTLGLFSNDDLYQAENFHHEEEHEEEEEDDSLLMDELEDTDHDDLGNGLFARYGVSGGGGGTSPRSRSPMFLGRLRSSTVRKFSTATNISVDDEEEGGGGANKFGSPHTPPLGKSYRPLNSCGAPSAGIASKGRNTHSDEKTKKGGGGIAAQLSLSLPLEVTESPLHAHPVRPAAAAVLVVEHRGGGTAGDGTGTDEVKEDSPSPSPPADWTPRSSRSNSGRDNDEGGGGAMDAESPSRATPPEGYLINNATATSAQGLTNRSVSDDIGGTYNAIFSVAQHEQTAGNTGGSPVTPRSGYRSASGLQLPLFMGNLNLERPSTPPLPPPPLDVNNTPFQVHSVESPPHAVSRAFAAEPDEGPPGGELDRVERLPSSQK